MARGLLTAGVVALGMIGGCDGDTAGPGDSGIGAYDLTRVNGFPLPSVVLVDETEDLTCTHTVTGGNLVLAPTTFVAGLTVHIVCVDAETEEEVFSETESPTSAGHYTRAGNTLTFTTIPDAEEGQDTFTGLLAGSTLTIPADEDGLPLTLEFTRQ